MFALLCTAWKGVPEEKACACLLNKYRSKLPQVSHINICPVRYQQLGNLKMTVGAAIVKRDKAPFIFGVNIRIMLEQVFHNSDAIVACDKLTEEKRVMELNYQKLTQLVVVTLLIILITHVPLNNWVERP